LGVGAVFLLVYRAGFLVRREHWKFLLADGLVLSLFNSLWTISVKLNGAAISTWLPSGVASTNIIWLGPSVAGWITLILLGIGPTVGGSGLYTVSLTYLPASVAYLIAAMEPAMTAGLAFILLGERFNAPQWIGSVLIMGSVVLLRFRESD
jgi:drug/metabolite transporter (DMT)-like permease